MEHTTFALWGKWFWIAIISAALNPLAGLMVGVGVLTEQDRRKEGLIIIAWSIIWWTALVIIALKFGGARLNVVQPQQ